LIGHAAFGVTPFPHGSLRPGMLKAKERGTGKSGRKAGAGWPRMTSLQGSLPFPSTIPEFVLRKALGNS
jgi:hypothetical protein